MIVEPVSLAVGFIGSAIIAGAAYRRRSLTASGAGAAVVVGTVLYAFGGVAWYVPMIVFFLTSSLLTKWKSARKRELEQGYAKSGARDAMQVAANGGLATLLCLVHAIYPVTWWWTAYLGVMAAATADTWATEIGGAFRRKTISIRTLKPVEPGQSGGISGPGTLGSAAGALTISLVAAITIQGIYDHAGYVERILILAVTVGGFCGAVSDSWLGATLQRTNRCSSCGKLVESEIHCGVKTSHAQGLAWLDNDAVNVAGTLVGGLVTAAIYAIIV